MPRSPTFPLVLLGLGLLSLSVTACGSVGGDAFCGIDDDTACDSRSLRFARGSVLHGRELQRDVDPTTSAELASFVANVERAMLRGKAIVEICSFDEGERQRPIHVFVPTPSDSGPLTLRQADSLAVLEASNEDFSYVDVRGQLVELRASGELAVELSYTCGTKHRISHPRVIVTSGKIETKYVVVPRGEQRLGDERLDVHLLYL